MGDPCRPGGTNIQRGNAVQGGVWGTRAGDKYPLNEQVAANATKATRTPVGMERYLTFFLMCAREHEFRFLLQ